MQLWAFSVSMNGADTFGEPLFWFLRAQRKGLKGSDEGAYCVIEHTREARAFGMRLTRAFAKPTVCLYVTSLVVSSYGYDDGKDGPTRCAVIGAARGDR